MRVPNFIKPLDLEKERNLIVEEFKQKSKKLDYIPLIGDDYMTLIDIFLFRLSKFIEFINYQISNNYLNFSSGEYLDELVALIGLKRIEAVKPVAKIKFRATSPTFLSKGTKLTDGKGHFAYLSMDLEVKKEAEVFAELDSYTDEQYQTTILEVPNIYISNVEIVEPFKGYKTRESDDELRKRFLLSLHRFSTAGSKKSYLFYVLSIEGIKKANVYRLSPGVVRINHFSIQNALVIKEKIKDALKDRVPLTDDIVIKEANKVLVDLRVKISLKERVFFAEALKNADSEIKTLFSELEIGENLHSSRIVDRAFFNDKNIKAIEILSQIPTITRDDILVLNSLEILKGEWW